MKVTVCGCFCVGDLKPIVNIYWFVLVLVDLLLLLDVLQAVVLAVLLLFSFITL